MTMNKGQFVEEWDNELAAREAELLSELEEVRGKREHLKHLRNGTGVGAKGVIRGYAILDAAHELAEAKDPEQRGLHYNDITDLLLEEYQIVGKDRYATVNAAIGAGERAKQKFDRTGKGIFRWK